MKVPVANQVYPLSVIPFEIKEMLDYVAQVATMQDTIGYNCDSDQVIYHLEVNDIDRETFPGLLSQAKEIWVIQAGINAAGAS